MITIYHNPKCSTSRTVLQTLRDAGHEPLVIDYMKHPLSRSALARLAQEMPVRDMLRTKEPLAKEMGLTHPGTPDEDVIAAIADNPVLLNRPIVTTPKGSKACRPADVVQSLL